MIFKISRRIIWRDIIFPKDFCVCYTYRATSKTNELEVGESFLKVNLNSDRDCNMIQMLRTPREQKSHVELSLDSWECGNMTSHAKACEEKQSSTANCLAGTVYFYRFYNSCLILNFFKTDSFWYSQSTGSCPLKMEYCSERWKGANELGHSKKYICLDRQTERHCQ